ncbi:MAG: FAD-binding protein, partial [Proteobacteria bacterium]|nr:FAD-binding protein [Pseudomonadota bacterium]
AARVGGAGGATRAAVDSGFAANDLQIGQSGKVVAPDVYLAIGISGAIQHLAGMRDSSLVVAINHDEAAPIVEHADIVWVEDLFAALRQIDEALTRRGR